MAASRQHVVVTEGTVLFMKMHATDDFSVLCCLNARLIFKPSNASLLVAALLATGASATALLFGHILH